MADKADSRLDIVHQDNEYPENSDITILSLPIITNPNEYCYCASDFQARLRNIFSLLPEARI
jgi:hypothetical protein